MRAVYPGSFDPVTNGHLDIIRRAAQLVDELVVSVLINTAKNPLFTLEERVRLLEEATADIPNVRVDSFSGLLINYMKENDIPLIIKGLRAISDFEAEFQMALMNRRLSPGAETVFLMTANEHSYLSSSIIKEIWRLGGGVEELVPPAVSRLLAEKMSHTADRSADKL